MKIKIEFRLKEGGFLVSKIKVLIVEDDPSWINVLESLLQLESDIVITAIATNKEFAIKAAKENDLDIILMDINLSGNNCDGIYAAAEIYNFSTAKIIMLTSLNESDIIMDSFKAGAVNFILKDNYNEISKAIVSIYNKTTPIELVLKDYLKLKEEEQLKELTPAEKEIFELIKSGYTQQNIKSKLFKSENTIKKQVGMILKKLGVKSSREAIKKVKMKGLFGKDV